MSSAPSLVAGHTLLIITQVQTLVAALDGDHTWVIVLTSAWLAYKANFR